MRTVLVTGGAGYIGSHIVHELIRAGEQVVIYDIKDKPDVLNLSHAEYVQGDIRNRHALDETFLTHPIDAVIHCAALTDARESIEKPDLYHDVNALGSRSVWVTALRSGVKNFIYASSAAVYGVPGHSSPLSEESPLIPSNPYGQSKLLGEKYLVETVGQTGTYISFRFFNVCGVTPPANGPCEDSVSICNRLFQAAYTQSPITINGNDYDTPDGTVIRDYIHPQDIARACVLGLAFIQSGNESGIFNLGSGKPITLLQLVKIVEDVSGLKVPVEIGPRTAGDIGYSAADIRKAASILHWKPSKNIHEIVRDGWDYFIQQQKLRARD